MLLRSSWFMLGEPEKKIYEMTKGGAITKGKSSQETNYETQGSIFIL